MSDQEFRETVLDSLSAIRESLAGMAGDHGARINNLEATAEKHDKTLEKHDSRAWAFLAWAVITLLGILGVYFKPQSASGAQASAQTQGQRP